MRPQPTERLLNLLFNLGPTPNSQLKIPYSHPPLIASALAGNQPVERVGNAPTEETQPRRSP